MSINQICIFKFYQSASGKLAKMRVPKLRNALRLKGKLNFITMVKRFFGTLVLALGPRPKSAWLGFFGFWSVNSCSGRIGTGNESSLELALLLLAVLGQDAVWQLIHRVHRLLGVPEKFKILTVRTWIPDIRNMDILSVLQSNGSIIM